MYIFLDIDGVLNTQSQWSRMYQLNTSCIENFCTFVKQQSNAKIILTSSWRSGFEKNGSCLPQIQNLIDKLSVYDVSIFDKTKKSPNDDRQREIEYFLQRNPKEPYIIIDDDKTLYHGIKGLYITDAKIGFSQKDIKKAGKAIVR